VRPFVLEAVDLGLEPLFGRLTLTFGRLLAGVLQPVDTVVFAIERGVVGFHRQPHRELTGDRCDRQPVQRLRDDAVPVFAVA
jgi:hypothetical protein